MLYNLPIQNILFLDIETVPMTENYEQLPEHIRELWDKQSRKLSTQEEQSPAELYSSAGLFAEFGKVICISVGYMANQEFRVKSFYGEDEALLLDEFAEMLNQYFTGNENFLCAHNGKEFDFPFIARRLLINDIKLPDILNTAVLKPWQVRFIDTMELWKFGNYRKYTSLNLLTAVFDIPTPKDDIDGSQVREIYYKEQDLERIKNYCQKDVIATFQLYRRFVGEKLMPGEHISFVT